MANIYDSQVMVTRICDHHVSTNLAAVNFSFSFSSSSEERVQLECKLKYLENLRTFRTAKHSQKEY